MATSESEGLGGDAEANVSAVASEANASGGVPEVHGFGVAAWGRRFRLMQKGGSCDQSREPPFFCWMPVCGLSSADGDVAWVAAG